MIYFYSLTERIYGNAEKNHRRAARKIGEASDLIKIPIRSAFINNQESPQLTLCNSLCVGGGFLYGSAIFEKYIPLRCQMLLC